jgi:hypothetical protein
MNSSVIYGKLGSGIKTIPIVTPRRCDHEASKDDSEERWLKLQINQGYGATCVPAGIDE